jgi:photosystem II protein
VGRVAQLGFAASLIGEMMSGKGPLAQLNFETGIPIVDAEFGILVTIAFMLFASVNPGSGHFVDDEKM